MRSVQVRTFTTTHTRRQPPKKTEQRASPETARDRRRREPGRDRSIEAPQSYHRKTTVFDLQLCVKGLSVRQQSADSSNSQNCLVHHIICRVCLRVAAMVQGPLVDLPRSSFSMTGLDCTNGTPPQISKSSLGAFPAIARGWDLAQLPSPPSSCCPASSLPSPPDSCRQVAQSLTKNTIDPSPTRRDAKNRKASDHVHAKGSINGQTPPGPSWRAWG